MTLTYLRAVLDPNKEYEIFPEDMELGFKVTIVYTENSWYPNKTEVCNNITEVHNICFSYPVLGADKRIAFESDIHGTGFHRNCNDIVSVTIKKATKLEKEF